MPSLNRSSYINSIPFEHMIFIISDSHVPRRADRIPQEFTEKAEEAETVVHCGDFVSKDLHDELEKISEEFVPVKGNCDLFRLESSKTFTRKGIDFGVYHGSGIRPRGHHPTLVETAEKLDSDVLFHGHTHQQEAVESQGKVLLNPGSCTGVSGGSASSGNPTAIKVEVTGGLEVDLLEIKGERVVAETVSFDV